MKKSNKKKVLIIIAAVLVIAIGATVGIILLRNHNVSVYVQPVEYLNENYILSGTTLNGTITESAEQREYLDSSSDISEVYVKQGDQVKKGDKLFKYNTELIELNIAEKQLSVEIYNNELKKLNAKLTEYEAIVPVKPTPTQPETDPPADDPDTVPDPIDEPEDIPVPDPDDTDDAALSDDMDDDTDESGDEPDITYTEEEKRELIADTKREINEMQNNLGIANTELDKAKLELNDAIVRATVSGKVTVLQSKKKPDRSEPFCVIAGDTGVKLEGYLSEFDLYTTEVGDAIQVTSWMSGSYTEAEIQEIDTYPAEGRYFYREGNQNTSYYRFTAFMDESEGFSIGEDVEIRKADGADLSAIVIQKIYTRSDKDGQYVMIDDGTGKLKKQYVTTQKCSQSGYIIISDGITNEDMIAFPYGNGLIEGANTTTEYSMNIF